VRTIIFALTALFATPAAAFDTVAVISGIAGVRDGDDVLFGSVPVRLQGIAAPEDRGDDAELGGRSATEHLRNMLDGKFVVCHLDGSTAGSSRGAGVCYLGLVEVNLRQVEAGFARDCPSYSKGRYAEAEERARQAGRDLSAVYALPSYCE
jgi:micrococcal nuclease